jgi:hypothetical protein
MAALSPRSRSERVSLRFRPFADLLIFLGNPCPLQSLYQVQRCRTTAWVCAGAGTQMDWSKCPVESFGKSAAGSTGSHPWDRPFCLPRRWWAGVHPQRTGRRGKNERAPADLARSPPRFTGAWHPPSPGLFKKRLHAIEPTKRHTSRNRAWISGRSRILSLYRLPQASPGFRGIG